MLGVEDMGLQDGKGVEMRLATDGAADTTTTQATEEQAKAEPTDDKDGDIVLTDTNPKEGEEAQSGGPSTEPLAGNAESEPTGDSSQAPDAEKKA